MAETRAPSLDAQDVAYRYVRASSSSGSAPAPALAPISLSARPGELLLVSGPSGSGKSTLARCLTGLIPHLYRGTLEGAVRLAGLDTRHAPLWRLSERAGLVFQNPAGQMLASSVAGEIIFGLENLGLSPGRIGRRLDAALERFALTAMRDRAPHTLSGGEQQKLALAAIMARQPPVLGLDEPLSMLDTRAAFDLVDHLGALVADGATVVVCEHRAEFFRRLPSVIHVQLAGTPSAPSVEAEPPSFAPRAPFDLVVDGLSVRLDGRPVLRDVSFSLAGGQTLAIVGRNGAGKTTLLRALAGLQEHAGVVRTSGGRRPRLGLVFQNAELQLFNASVREEVLYGVADPDIALYKRLLRLLGLAAYEGTPPLLLSEGEKKRVALATVLMRSAAADGLLLDEPALGQDRAHKRTLVRLLRALAASGRLAILTTHDLALAAHADRLLVLHEGAVAAVGPTPQLLRAGALWRRTGLLVPPWVLEEVT